MNFYPQTERAFHSVYDDWNLGNQYQDCVGNQYQDCVRNQYQDCEHFVLTWHCRCTHPLPPSLPPVLSFKTPVISTFGLQQLHINIHTYKE